MRVQRAISRRGFLKRALATAAFPAIIPGSALGANGAVAPSSRVTLGFIGTGSHGIGMNLKNFLPQPDAQVVALCDVDAPRVKEAHDIVRQHYAQQRPEGKFAGCFTTGDWREIVDRDDVDAVVISTPDHWHVIPAVAAARAGKDVFCEKPLTLTVHEGRVLSDTMTRYGRVFQTGSENRSKWNFLRAAELVRNGRIGTLQTIRTQLPVDKAVKYANGRIHPPRPVPQGLDYDLWLGQAPWKPYTPGRVHYHFRWILDYSGGSLTDWGAHINDVAQWANDTEYTGPVSVEGHGVFPPEGLYNTASEWEVTFEYANGVRLICTDGKPLIRFEGTDGWIECGWDTFKASSPRIHNAVIGPGEVRLRTCPQREQRDFLDCVKSRSETYAPAEVGHRSITLSHIGNISMILGRGLRWDPDAERFINDETANRMLSRTMRSPWQL
ncbi:MAG: Gfo/Idh/MocA family oxidoreductase [Nitrospiraceae bacterium]|nr:Gfo/Idh/MocA family oxidoreductase [Nitrospiraceae bacterium]